MIKIVSYTIGVLALSAVCSAHAESEKTVEALGMQLFMGVCVPSRSDVQVIEAGLKNIKMVELSSKDSKPFLADALGKVWSTQETGGQFTVAATAPQTCTVFIDHIQPQVLKQEFERWLPPAGSGLSVKKEADDKQGEVETASYAILRGDKLVFSWVLRTAQRPQGGIGTLSVRAAVD